MSDLPRILLLGADEPNAWPPELQSRLEPQFEVVKWTSDGWPDPPPDGNFRCVVLCGEPSHALPELWQWDGVLKHLPQGVAVIDTEFRIRWCNERLEILTNRPELLGLNFLEAFGTPDIVGPDFSPFQSHSGVDESSTTTLRLGDKSFFEVVAAPVYVDGEPFAQLAVVTVRDVSSEMVVRQKLKAIFQAGLEMGELSAEDLVELTVDERVELLKQKIIQFTRNVLEFKTIEVRLLDKRTNELEQLLHVDMSEEAAHRKLFASEQGNGVTGYVAATGKSYLCPDTSRDARYLPGAQNARSSLTVPLLSHNEVLGTFNVESAQVQGFSAHDQQFLELFCREVAGAINTLDLLAVEKMFAATANRDLILKEIARPVDEILNDTTWILERYIGHDPDVAERLQRILKQTRSVRTLVHHIGENVAPAIANPPLQLRPQRPKLKHKRVLVVDNDEQVRSAAHELLGRFGCEVETAQDGMGAARLVRNVGYDVVILDIRLTDMTGYECFVKLREIKAQLPVILMTGFGYDPDHSIVKARQAGLKSVLYKPFRLDQLLKEVETAVSGPSEAA